MFNLGRVGSRLPMRKGRQTVIRECETVMQTAAKAGEGGEQHSEGRLFLPAFDPEARHSPSGFTSPFEEMR